MQILTIAALGIFGLIFGSFVNALVWRLRKQDELRQADADTSSKPKKEKITASNAKLVGTKKSSKLEKKEKDDYSILHGRSMCPNCHHVLAAKDLVPVFSWLSLGGKCRYCRQPISKQYPLVELLTAVLFIFSLVFWPYGLSSVLWQVTFGLWLVLVVVFVALTVYDIHWQELPDELVITSFAVALPLSLIIAWQDGAGWNDLLQGLFAVVILSGLFWILFEVSKGRWIGGGDVKLAIALGLLAGTPLKALLIIFISSLLGTLIVLPRVLKDRKNLKSVLPYGPLLIVATVIVFYFGKKLIDWYQSLFLLM